MQFILIICFKIETSIKPYALGALNNNFTLTLYNKSINYSDIRVNKTRFVVLNGNLIICCAYTYYRLYTFMYTYNMSEREYNIYIIGTLSNYFIQLF